MNILVVEQGRVYSPQIVWGRVTGQKHREAPPRKGGFSVRPKNREEEVWLLEGGVRASTGTV